VLEKLPLNAVLSSGLLVATPEYSIRSSVWSWKPLETVNVSDVRPPALFAT
jgi:hypothetical protein